MWREAETVAQDKHCNVYWDLHCNLSMCNSPVIPIFDLAWLMYIERTRITEKPTSVDVKEGDNVDLKCAAVFDDQLEIRYFWKRDDARIDYIQNVIEWDLSRNVLRIYNIKVEDAGVYTCIAYTPEPRRSEDSASAIINIQGMFDITWVTWLRSLIYSLIFQLL